MRIYLESENKIIEYEEGTGDNLLPEDREMGFVDYINYTIYDIEDLEDVHEDDGGMILLDFYFDDKFRRTETDSLGRPCIKVDEAAAALYVLHELGLPTAALNLPGSKSDDYLRGWQDGAYENELLMEQENEGLRAEAYDAGFDAGWNAAVEAMKAGERKTESS